MNSQIPTKIHRATKKIPSKYIKLSKAHNPSEQHTFSVAVFKTLKISFLLKKKKLYHSECFLKVLFSHYIIQHAPCNHFLAMPAP